MFRLPAGVEERTRVVCALPLVKDPTKSTFREVTKSFTRLLDYIESQQRYDIGIDGYTLSGPGSYNGYWKSSREGGHWGHDDITLLIVDYRLPLADGSMWVKLRELRIEFLEAYPLEEEVWITATTIYRQTQPGRANPASTPQPASEYGQQSERGILDK